MEQPTENVPGQSAELSLEQRVAALENQLYVIYLQANAVTKLVLDKGILTREEVTKEMDALNQEIFNIVGDVVGDASGEPQAPVAEEAPVTE